MKFKPAEHGNRTTPVTDEVGIIVVKIFLSHKGHSPKKGNIIKTLRVKEAKVSEVYDAIKHAIITET